jgi:hypothetical protein
MNTDARARLSDSTLFLVLLCRALDFSAQGSLVVL